MLNGHAGVCDQQILLVNERQHLLVDVGSASGEIHGSSPGWTLGAQSFIRLSLMNDGDALQSLVETSAMTEVVLRGNVIPSPPSRARLAIRSID